MSWSTPNLHKPPTVQHHSSPALHSQHRSRHQGSDDGSFSSESGEQHFPPDPPLLEHAYDDDEEGQCLRHLDELGLALEKTFKKVESIDNYVNKLRSDFDNEMLSEHRFMKCICSARIARAVCCQKQVKAWRDLQHGFLDFCCHHYHHHEGLTQHSDDCEMQHVCDASSTSSHDSDVEVLLGQLTKLSTFDLVKQRLDPEADARSFVEHWIMHNNHHDDMHQEDDPHN